MLINDEEARAVLQAIVDAYGGTAPYARAIGVTRQFVYKVLQGEQAITGKLAQDLGFKRVIAYEVTDTHTSNLQKQYENRRSIERERAENLGYKMSGGARDLTEKRSVRLAREAGKERSYRLSGQSLDKKTADQSDLK